MNLEDFNSSLKHKTSDTEYIIWVYASNEIASYIVSNIKLNLDETDNFIVVLTIKRNNVYYGYPLNSSYQTSFLLEDVIGLQDVEIIPGVYQ